MALRRLVGFSGVCVSRELWAHRDRAFGALGRTCPSPPGASCMEKKKSQIPGSICWSHFYTHSNPKFFSRGMLWIIQREKGRDHSRTGQGRRATGRLQHAWAVRGPFQKRLCLHARTQPRQRVAEWGSSFTKIFINSSKPRLIVVQPALYQFSNLFLPTKPLPLAPVTQKSWSQPSAWVAIYWDIWSSFVIVEMDIV